MPPKIEVYISGQPSTDHLKRGTHPGTHNPLVSDRISRPLALCKGQRGCIGMAPNTLKKGYPFGVRRATGMGVKRVVQKGSQIL